MNAKTREEQRERARSCLRTEVDHGFAAMKLRDFNKARRHVAMGAYYLGHLHAYGPTSYVAWKDESDDPDDARFHSLMHHLDKELKSRE